MDDYLTKSMKEFREPVSNIRCMTSPADFQQTPSKTELTFRKTRQTDKFQMYTINLTDGSVLSFHSFIDSGDVKAKAIIKALNQANATDYKSIPQALKTKLLFASVEHIKPGGFR